MRKKILVVDDDPDLVGLLRFNFKKAGFAVGTAAHGIEALKKVQSVEPDLIVLDLMLPQLDGLAVLETLRRNEATAAIPVLMLTALSGELARYSGLESGANEFMTKPFQVKELLLRVRNLLAT